MALRKQVERSKRINSKRKKVRKLVKLVNHFRDTTYV